MKTLTLNVTLTLSMWVAWTAAPAQADPAQPSRQQTLRQLQAERDTALNLHRLEAELMRQLPATEVEPPAMVDLAPLCLPGLSLEPLASALPALRLLTLEVVPPTHRVAPVAPSPSLGSASAGGSLNPPPASP